MNRLIYFIFCALFLSIYLGVELFNNQSKIVEHYKIRAAESDSSAQYYFIKYLECKSK